MIGAAIFASLLGGIALLIGAAFSKAAGYEFPRLPCGWRVIWEQTDGLWTVRDFVWSPIVGHPRLYMKPLRMKPWYRN